MGRPSKFSPAYCDELIECLAKGYSIEGFAGYIGVAKCTVYKWVKDYPEFAEAHEIAKAKASYFWEGQLIAGKLPPTLLIYGVQNRTDGAWHNVQKVEHTGKDGGPIKTEDTTARDKLLDLVSRVSEREQEAKDNRKPH